MDVVSNCISQRLGGRDFGKSTAVYKFAKIKALKAQVRQGSDIELFDLGVGEPDKPADQSLVRILAQEAQRSENRFYADNGIAEFQQAAAQFLSSFYHVDIADPLKGILHTIGSKPALAMLPLCFIDPGDVALMTVPGYPVTGTYTQYLGGEVYSLPLRKENSYFPDLSDIPASVLKRAKLLYINYPNNPTGQTATKQFYQRVVEFADKHGIVVISDAAYSALVLNGEPLSFLSVEGAKGVGVEIHSLSKSFNMTGWRLGFVAGNEKIVSALANVKDNTDSGQFRAIQKAGIYALAHPELIYENQARYKRRFSLLIPALQAAGFDAAFPKGTFYCYTAAFKGAADGTRFASAEECAEYLIKKALISTVPWDDAGAYLRISATFEADGETEERRITGELQTRLVKLGLQF